MEQLSVERSIWIEAPRARVWQAVTEPDQLAQWFLPPAMGAQMKRDEGGRLVVVMGPMEAAIAIQETFDPPHLFTTRSLPDRLLATTFTLIEERGGTLVTVTLTGLEALPEADRQDRLAPAGAGWEQALQNLKAHLAGEDLPFPYGGVAALSGFRRETPARLAVERSIWIKAPRPRVWQALTDPQQVQQWFSPGTDWELSTMAVGGKLFHRDPETGAEQYAQVIEVFDPPRQLVMRSEPEPPEVPHRIYYTLEEENGGTRLTLLHSGYELEPEDQRYANSERDAFGFGMMLENLQAHLEGRSLPYPCGF